MKALVFNEFGDADVLHVAELPTPPIGPNQALVRVESAGLNFADVYRRNGNYHLVGKAPWVLGYEGAGVVADIAVDDPEIKKGARVAFADSPQANAEFAIVDIDRLIPLPDDISADVAAALLLQGLTAQYLARDSYAAKSGEVAVVHAAAGGVGLLLTQLLKLAKTKVIAVASTPEKREAARRAGADCVIGVENWSENVREFAPSGADVIYDSVGSTLGDSLATARTGGTVVFFGMAGGDPPPVDARVLMDRSLSLVGGDLWNVLTSAAIRRSRANELFDLVRKGALDVKIAARFPLARGADAHRMLEGRGVIGKIILTV
ncbi:MAG TPA: quinone oxidoreductase [Parvularculaceae bacterium]|nr:quinone oxidoreductase [Parvularculaceae bacterium]